MRKIFKIACLICVGLLFQTIGAWGFLGHKTINRHAVFALPTELFGFYKMHIDFVTTHSVDPDNRRYLIAEEACRHFLDCDFYERTAPLDTLPHNWLKATEMYTEDSLKQHGIVPWHILYMLQRLTHAFEEGDVQKILKNSADIGHYVADAHVPLHASQNYNGQHTGQEGIHALWESRIPQLFLDSFDLFTGTAPYLENPTEYIWKIIEESFALKDSVLFLETQVSALHTTDKYSMESVGRNMVSVYSPAFCLDYNTRMQNMVERRMRASIKAVAAFWYTAWVNAGQPNLQKISGMVLEDKSGDELPKGKMKGRDEN